MPLTFCCYRPGDYLMCLSQSVYPAFLNRVSLSQYPVNSSGTFVLYTMLSYASLYDRIDGIFIKLHFRTHIYGAYEWKCSSFNSCNIIELGNICLIKTNITYFLSHLIERKVHQVNMHRPTWNEHLIPILRVNLYTFGFLYDYVYDAIHKSATPQHQQGLPTAVLGNVSRCNSHV